MSLVINTTTPEGIVIAADSRQSYRNRIGVSRIGSDNAQKLFQINDRIGVGITGLAFIVDNGVLKNVSLFIDEFIENNEVNDMDVLEVAKKLHEKYISVYNIDEQFKNLQANIQRDLTQQGAKNIKFNKQDNILQFTFERNGKVENGNAGIEQINFLVAGFNKDKTHEVYICYLPGDIQKKRDSQTPGIEYGASWLGQTDLVSRIILGFDPRMGNLQSINQLIGQIGPDRFNQEIRNLEYSIQWGTMTLQDGVDFSDLMIKTTSAIQRFSDGIAAEPGDMPGVGGEVDIAIITKKDGFKWVNKKNIRYQ